MKAQPTVKELLEMLYEQVPDFFDRNTKQKEWVDLTDEEIEDLAKWADKNAAPWHIEFARAVLKAAKEKNT